MTKQREVWVFIEQQDGCIAPVSLELLTKARELVEQLDGRVCALLFGHGVADLAETVVHHGADVVLLADHPELAVYRTLPYARVAIDLVQAEDRLFVDDFLDAEPNRLSEGFRETLYQRTGGHALFTVELVRGLTEETLRALA